MHRMEDRIGAVVILLRWFLNIFEKLRVDGRTKSNRYVMLGLPSL